MTSYELYFNFDSLQFRPATSVFTCQTSPFALATWPAGSILTDVCAPVPVQSTGTALTIGRLCWQVATYL